jgi:hypothetical protein
MADTSDLKFQFPAFYRVALGRVKNLRTMMDTGFIAVGAVIMRVAIPKVKP